LPRRWTVLLIFTQQVWPLLFRSYLDTGLSMNYLSHIWIVSVGSRAVVSLMLLELLSERELFHVLKFRIVSISGDGILAWSRAVSVFS
jgi:hypothetical protein